MANRNPHNREIIKPGTKFNHWTVGTEYESRKNYLYFKCKCVCGQKRFVRAASLRLGVSISCGCVKETHKMSKHPLYSTWNKMVARCHDYNNRDYPIYGGRGIKVCKRWRDPIKGIKCFIKDMGEKPSDKHSLDRINNDDDYKPSNCRWATDKQQINNRSNTIKAKRTYGKWICTGNERSIDRGKYGKRLLLEVICGSCNNTFWRQKYNLTSGKTKQCKICSLSRI